MNAYGDLYTIAFKEHKAICLKVFERKAFSGLEVLDSLKLLAFYNWSPSPEEANFKPKPREAIKTLEKLMDKLKASTGGQTFAFVNNTALEVWNKKINVHKEFKFLKRGSDHIGPETNGMLTYEQFLPFNNQNPDNRDCVAATYLPEFYRKKRRE